MDRAARIITDGFPRRGPRISLETRQRHDYRRIKSLGRASAPSVLVTDAIAKRVRRCVTGAKRYRDTRNHPETFLLFSRRAARATHRLRFSVCGSLRVICDTRSAPGAAAKPFGAHSANHSAAVANDACASRTTSASASNTASSSSTGTHFARNRS